MPCCWPGLKKMVEPFMGRGILLLVFLKLALVKCTTLTVGVLLTWDKSSPTYSAPFPGVINLAFDEIKAQNLLPGYDVRWVWHDTHCNEDDAQAAMLDLEEFGVDAIVGPACNQAAAKVYEFAQYYETPLVVWGASTNKLSSEASYPNLVRIIGQYSAMAKVMAATVSEFEWDRVAVLHVDDARQVYSPTAETVVSAMEELSITTESFEFDEVSCSGDSSQVGEVLDTIAASYRIVVVVARCIDYRELLLQARSKEMLEGYAWLLLDTPHPQYCYSSEAMCGSSDGQDAEAMEAFSGAISFVWKSSALEVSTDVFLNSVEGNNRRFGQTIIPPNGTAAIPNGITMNAAGYDYAIDTAAELTYAPFLYDSLLLTAMTLNRSEAHTSVENFYSMAKSLTLEGKSGPIAFNTDGERIYTDAAVVNVVSEGGSLAASEIALYDASSGAYSLEVSVSTIQWPGGETEKPSSIPEITEDSSGFSTTWLIIILVVGVVGLACVGLGLAFGCWYWRGKKLAGTVYVMQDSSLSEQKDGFTHANRDLRHPSTDLSPVPVEQGPTQGTPAPALAQSSGQSPPSDNGPTNTDGPTNGGFGASGNHSSMNMSMGNQYQPPTEAQRKLIEEEMENIPAETKNVLKEIEIDPNELELREIIGTGAFAEVRACRYRGSMVAVKALHELSQESIRRFRYEVLLMKDLRHPNIILLIGASWVGNKLMMVVEYMENGSMADALSPQKTPALNWKDHKLEMVCDVARGMTYLHHARYFNERTNKYETCIIHRDLKPQNLLVTRSYGIKITDFGEARAKNQNATMTAVGTLLYIAPEVVRGDRYDEKCDVYSFAIVMLAALQLKPNIVDVFAETIQHEATSDSRPQTYTPMYITTRIVNEHLRPQLPDGVIFPSLKILIEQAWSPAPALRPTFDEILEYLETIVRDEVMENRFEDDSPLPSAQDVLLSDAMERATQQPTSAVEQNHSLRLRKRDKNFRPGKGETAREYIAKNKQLAAKMYENDIQRGAIAEEDEEEEESDEGYTETKDERKG